MEDALLYFGGQIKALGNGKIGGYTVLFTDEDSPDLLGDFFSESTDFGLEAGGKRIVLYDHGMDPTLGRRKLAYADIKKKDKVGLWAEAQLALRDDYEKALYALVAKGKMGWSSGTAGHLVARTPMKKAHRIDEWPIIEISITPTPAEPRTSVVSLKSLQPEPLILQPDKTVPQGPLATKLSRYIDDLVDDGQNREDLIKRIAEDAVMDEAEVEKVLSGEFKRPSNVKLKAFSRVLNLPFDTLKTLADKSTVRSIKDLFSDEMANRTPSTYELQSIYCCVVKKIAEAAATSRAVGTEYDYASQLEEATGAYLDRLKMAVMTQVQSYVESEDAQEFYLKAIQSLSKEDFYAASKGVDLDDHSELVVTAVRDIVARFWANHEARKSQKAGRVLSEKNRSRLTKMLEAIQAAVSDCQGLLDESMPMASEMEKRAAIIKHLRTKARCRELGVNS